MRRSPEGRESLPKVAAVWLDRRRPARMEPHSWPQALGSVCAQDVPKAEQIHSSDLHLLSVHVRPRPEQGERRRSRRWPAGRGTDAAEGPHRHPRWGAAHLRVAIPARLCRPARQRARPPLQAGRPHPRRHHQHQRVRSAVHRRITPVRSLSQPLEPGAHHGRFERRLRRRGRRRARRGTPAAGW